MNSFTKTINLLFCILSVLVAMVTISVLSYEWSFTETTFGGYAGVIVPVALCIYCFVAGIFVNKLAGACDD